MSWYADADAALMICRALSSLVFRQMKQVRYARCLTQFARQGFRTLWHRGATSTIASTESDWAAKLGRT